MPRLDARHDLSAAGRVAEPLGDGVYLIDTVYVRPGLAASHLVVDRRSRGVRRHRRGAGGAAAAGGARRTRDRARTGRLPLPDPRAPRPRGRRRAADRGPAQREGRAASAWRAAPRSTRRGSSPGSIAVYGEAMYRQLYGEILPIPAERVLRHRGRHAHQARRADVRVHRRAGPRQAPPLPDRPRPPRRLRRRQLRHLLPRIRHRGRARSCCRRPRPCSSTPTHCTRRSTG